MSVGSETSSTTSIQRNPSDLIQTTTRNASYSPLWSSDRVLRTLRTVHLLSLELFRRTEKSSAKPLTQIGKNSIFDFNLIDNWKENKDNKLLTRNGRQSDQRMIEVKGQQITGVLLDF